MSLTVVTTNILSPHTALLRRTTPSQTERIPTIASDIALFDPDIVIASEVESEYALDQLAKETGLEVRTWRAQEDAREIIALLSKKSLSPERARTFQLGDRAGRYAAEMVLDNTIILGVHYPWQLTRSGERTGITQRITEITQDFDHAVVAGDFNSLPQQEARTRYMRAGFRAATATLSRTESGFPARYRSGQAIWPLGYILPKVQLDDIYVKGMHLGSAVATTTLSDHPILIARIDPITL